MMKMSEFLKPMTPERIFALQNKYNYKEELANKDKYVTLEYADISEVDTELNFYHVAIIDGRFSPIETRANSKEGWVEELISDNDGEPIMQYDRKTEEYKAVYRKRYGDVVIFKTYPHDPNKIMEKEK